jgi:hypothetical protein
MYFFNVIRPITNHFIILNQFIYCFMFTIFLKIEIKKIKKKNKMYTMHLAAVP